MADKPLFAVYRFYKDYAPAFKEVRHVNPVTGIPFMLREQIEGQMREVHKVEYGPLGSDKIRVPARVDDLRPKLRPGEDPQPGSAQEQAIVKWSVIEPLYQKWLKGQEITPEGIPLAAWAGVGPEQAEALRRRDIHTVQQLAALTDTHFTNYGIAGLRNLRDHAVKFLDSSGSAAIMHELEQRDIMIAGLQDTIATMAETLKQMQHSMANMQMAQQGEPTEDPDNDDAFGEDTGEPLIRVSTPRRKPRRETA